MFSEFFSAAVNEILKTRTANSARTLKASRTRYAKNIADNMNINLDFSCNNWYIIVRQLEQLGNTPTTTTASAPISGISSSRRLPYSVKSNNSSLGVPLSEDDKREIIASYNNVETKDIRRLNSSEKYLENIMKDFCEKSNYLQ